MRSCAWGPDPTGRQSLEEEEAAQSPLPQSGASRRKPTRKPGRKAFFRPAPRHHGLRPPGPRAADNKPPVCWALLWWLSRLRQEVHFFSNKNIN